MFAPPIVPELLPFEAVRGPAVALDEDVRPDDTEVDLAAVDHGVELERR